MLRFSCSEKPLGADATLWPNVTQINCQSPVAPTRRLTALGLRKQTTGIAAECLHVVVVRICLWGLGDPSRLEIINTPLNPRHTGTWCVFTEFPFALHVVGCIYIGIKSSSRFKYFPEGKKISPWVELPMEIAYKKMPISKLSHIGYPTNDDHNLNIGNSDSYSWNWVNFQSDSFESIILRFLKLQLFNILQIFVWFVKHSWNCKDLFICWVMINQDSCITKYSSTHFQRWQRHDAWKRFKIHETEKLGTETPFRRHSFSICQKLEIYP